MPIAQQLVQASHAAHECGLKHNDSGTPSSIIIFGISNQRALEQCFEVLSKTIVCHPFFEPYKDIGLTAFATDPIGEVLRPLLKSFCLWGRSGGCLKDLEALEAMQKHPLYQKESLS